MTGRSADRVLVLRRHSVLKQAKIRELCRAIGTLHDESCLDIGGDNGAVSAALRLHGGHWASADLDDRNVSAIRDVVGGDVRSMVGTTLPFDTASFDVVVIADMLEHVEDDRSLVRECARVLRSGGVLVANVPHVKRGSILNAIRHAIGLTDAWHGHVRPGYSIAGLRALLAPEFVVEQTRTYSRAFSEAIDLAMNGAFRMVNGSGGTAARNVKGTVVTGTDVARHGFAFSLLGMAYPFLWGFSRLDVLLPLQSGYKLIVRARQVAGGQGAMS